MIYRRILDQRRTSSRGRSRPTSRRELAENDYFLGPLIGVDRGEAARHLQRAKQLSLSLLYWLQTEAPRPDGGAGWRACACGRTSSARRTDLRKRPTSANHGESTREFTVLEQHVGTEARAQALKVPRET